jgi:hypothetical protein
MSIPIPGSRCRKAAPPESRSAPVENAFEATTGVGKTGGVGGDGVEGGGMSPLPELP